MPEERCRQPAQPRRTPEVRYEWTSTGKRSPDGVAMTPSSVVRELQELIAALDRRLPQVQRAGEASIARDAAALKARALRRIEELEREQPHGD